MRQFTAIKTEAKNGKSYTLSIWENVGKTKPLEYIGKTEKVVYGNQYGELSEAWQLALTKKPCLVRSLKRAGCAVDTIYFNPEYTENNVLQITVI